MHSRTLTGRKNEPKERQRKNKLGILLLQIPRKEKFPSCYLCVFYSKVYSVQQLLLRSPGIILKYSSNAF